MRIGIWKCLGPLLLVPSLATAAKPESWFLAGSDPSAYEMERDSTVIRAGKASGRLASKRTSKGFGTMMQSFDADIYKGKRLRYRAYVKALKVKDWAGLWMRSGEGTVWLNDVQLEAVDESVGTTGTERAKKPKNLDFGR